jgi:hypothetical protein
MGKANNRGSTESWDAFVTASEYRAPLRLFPVLEGAGVRLQGQELAGSTKLPRDLYWLRNMVDDSIREGPSVQARKKQNLN